jgi:FAD-linked sulfhydryl oxidase
MFRVAGLRARFAVVAVLVMVLCSLLLLGPYKVAPGHLALATAGRDAGPASGSLLTGHAIAPKLGNETAKYVGHCSTRGVEGAHVSQELS